MDDGFKKVCACGAMVVVIYGSTPLCKYCLDLRTPDLPSQGGFFYDHQEIKGSYVSGMSGSASIFTGFVDEY